MEKELKEHSFKNEKEKAQETLSPINDSYKNAADIELWKFCRQDDTKAYDELFYRYYPRMYRFVSGYIKDTMEAEELCMDQLFNLWVKRKQINIAGNFSHYLFRSTHNRIISHFRKTLPFTVSPDELKEEYQSSRTADYHLLSEEIRQIYLKALKKLSPRRRQVFLLSRIENLTSPEIAGKINLSTSTVENYMTAALSGIKKELKEYLCEYLILPLTFCTLFYCI
jgi:RNA polymerase sigma-70 factor (ECF subfamily)